jgi:hypothetical protein
MSIAARAQATTQKEVRLLERRSIDEAVARASPALVCCRADV